MLAYINITLSGIFRCDNISIIVERFANVHAKWKHLSFSLSSTIGEEKLARDSIYV